MSNQNLIHQSFINHPELKEKYDQNYQKMLKIQKSLQEKEEGRPSKEIKPGKKREARNPKGRPPGIKDVRSQFYDVVAMLEKECHDPLLAMCRLAKDPCADEKLKFLANKELALRIAPHKKEIEHNIGHDTLEALAKLKQKMEGLTIEYVKDY